MLLTFAAGSQSSTGIIVGVVVAVLVLGVLVVLGALRRRRQQAKTGVTGSFAYVSNTTTQGQPCLMRVVNDCWNDDSWL